MTGTFTTLRKSRETDCISEYTLERAQTFLPVAERLIVRTTSPAGASPRHWGEFLKILNLGCGTRTSAACINIDWSLTLRLKQHPLGRALAPLLLNDERLRNLNAMAGEVLVHNLRRSIPFGDSSIDAVYHSHVLEHLERVTHDDVSMFFHEIRRVLKPGGVHRIVVPDLAKLCTKYLHHYDECVAAHPTCPDHDDYIAAFIEQLVRIEPHGTSQQRAFRRWAENFILGDARRRGESHRWMYDQVNLAHALDKSGFREIQVLDFETSRIDKWDAIGLDRTVDGREYKMNSLYMEAIR